MVGGPSELIGRVEVKVKNKWYGVCGLDFKNRAAEVVCRELGLGFAKRGFSSSGYGKRLRHTFVLDAKKIEF